MTRRYVDYCSMLYMLLLHPVVGPDDEAALAASRTAGVPQLHFQELIVDMQAARFDVSVWQGLLSSSDLCQVGSPTRSAQKRGSVPPSLVPYREAIKQPAIVLHYR